MQPKERWDVFRSHSCDALKPLGFVLEGNSQRIPGREARKDQHHPSPISTNTGGAQRAMAAASIFLFSSLGAVALPCGRHTKWPPPKVSVRQLRN